MDMLYVLILVIFVVVPVVLPLVLIMRSVNRNGGTYWRKQKIFNIIISHRVFTVAEISQLSGISEKKLIPTLRFIVSEANTSPQGINLGALGIEVQTSFLGDVEFLRGSRLDLNKMEIILAENKAEDSKWACLYCNSINFAEALVCCACNARRQA